MEYIPSNSNSRRPVAGVTILVLFESEGTGLLQQYSTKITTDYEPRVTRYYLFQKLLRQVMILVVREDLSVLFHSLVYFQYCYSQVET